MRSDPFFFSEDDWCLYISDESGVPEIPDLGGDGKRFLAAIGSGERSLTPLTLVQNWTRLLERE
jgi:hypothetical protein